MTIDFDAMADRCYDAGYEEGQKEVVLIWQTMETFPRDGNSYLVCDNKILDGFHQVVFWDDEAVTKWCLATSDGPTFHFEAFTHWMPLPVPPITPPQ